MANHRLVDMAMCLYLLLHLLAWIPQVSLLHVIPGYENEKACYGTSTGMANNGDSNFRYQKFKDAYTNCTYVVGNLEIVFLDAPGVNYDMSFLSQIKEVAGYVLLVGNLVDYIPLTSLQIIRGSTLFRYNNTDFSLFVALNYQPGTDYGLKELRFKSLSEILAGKVFFQNNDRLCFENHINWTDINPRSKPSVIYIDDNKTPKRTCGVCHDSCYNNITNSTYCWGEGPNMCQKLSYGIVCHESCGTSRCFGSQHFQCCHSECAGGCTGSKNTDCFACRTFKDDGGCVVHCPKDTIYDKNLMMNIYNPDQKYAFGSMCVKECPGFLLQDANSCVRHCAEGKHSVDQKTCVPCQGPCPKKCKGIDPPDFLNLNNSKSFEGCTSIEGNMRILSSSFNRDDHFGIEPLHPHNLTVLKHVKEITGYLLIQSNHSEFTDLNFLSSLETIHGRINTESKGYALNIFSTPLRSLDLVSLKNISNGNVLIALNTKLCYADTIDWRSILRHSDQKYDIINNRPRIECELADEVCSPECGTTGCWGKGPNKCLKCAKYIYEEKSLCLNECKDFPRLYHSGGGKCLKCHEECANTCTGPNNTDCDSCAHVTMRNKLSRDSCEQMCASVMYADENRICQPCHPFCGGENGCTGPGKHVGHGGCKSCILGIRNAGSNIIECTNLPECPDGYFNSYSPSINGGMQFPFCEVCHEFCLTCKDPTPRFCSKCRYIQKDDYCVKDCPSFEFANTETRSCEKCNSECRTGCFGPNATDCVACANFKRYINIENKTFTCVQKCPPELPFLVKEIETDENRVVCADNSHPDVRAINAKNAGEDRQRLIIIISAVVPVAFFVVAMPIIITYFCHKRAQNNMKAAKYTAKITGVEEIEPLTPTNAKPDLAKMRIISEAELRKGAIIGSGAFGTVYKGIWIPQGENVKIPVAIKVLQEGTSPGQSAELLEEARVMCSVDNICCIRILAVCMRSEIMLVTQLMPHGNLLNYVRSNAQHIGSKALLNWCTQIARGMAYLEERGIVHRDLAARNVLVQTPNQVKITDFGLAKLLDSDSAEYRSTGGLMPIKWLALECILHRIFTHKSDVWSYGITIWELFTLGKKPYDNVSTKDVPILLEKGERLQQPMMCTIDVYMIMVKCWMLDADSRPSFKELQEEFAKMSRDPGRYLVIEGDSLMKLPSVSYDKNELIHDIGGGGSENVMEAEEYLRPIDPHRHLRPVSLIQAYDRQTSNSSSFSPATTGNYTDSVEGTKGGSLGLDIQKVREKQYSHLQAAVRAKQEREMPRHRDDNVSSRYSSDPTKLLHDKYDIEWTQNGDLLYSKGLSDHAHDLRSPKGLKSMVLPVDDDDYLRPGAAAQSLAYLDLDSKGYYQNEKETAAHKGQNTDETDAESDVFIASPGIDSKQLRAQDKHLMKNGPQGVAVANPDYFEEQADVWEQKKPLLNGYHPVPTSPTSPVHKNSKDNQNSSYKSTDGAYPWSPNSSQMVNTRVTIPGVRLDSPESKV